MEILKKERIYFLGIFLLLLWAMRTILGLTLLPLTIIWICTPKEDLLSWLMWICEIFSWLRLMITFLIMWYWIPLMIGIFLLSLIWLILIYLYLRNTSKIVWKNPFFLFWIIYISINIYWLVQTFIYYQFQYENDMNKLRMSIQEVQEQEK